MKKSSNIFIIITALFIASCNYGDTTVKPLPPVHKDFVSPALMAHFSFQPGTYWIYRDSLNGRLDSLVVVYNFLSLENPSTGYVFEDNIMDLRQLNIDGTAVSDSSLWQFYLYLNSFRVSNINVHPSPLFSYPFQVGVGGLMKIDSSYSLNGNSFDSVAEITIAPDNFYVNDSIGILKMRLYGAGSPYLSHVWELKRWHLIK